MWKMFVVDGKTYIMAFWNIYLDFVTVIYSFLWPFVQVEDFIK